MLIVPLVPILEELGWRGYVLDRLQERYNALTSSLILGVLWFFWHVPAFFYQALCLISRLLLRLNFGCI